MDARTGKKIRLASLLDPVSGGAVIVAASHGVQSGPPQHMATREEIGALFPALRGADGVMVAPGLLPLVEDIYLGRNAPALIVHMDWKNATRGVYRPNTEGRGEPVAASLAKVSEVSAAGATAIMTYLHVGQSDTTLERAEIERNARLVRECDRRGIVCIIEPRSAQEHVDKEHADSVAVVGFYCRLAAEIGADLVKCVWTGTAEEMHEVTSTCPAPIVLAGGPGGDDLETTLNLAHTARSAGVAGVMFGRRITSAADPAGVIAGLRAVVHQRGSVADSLAAAAAVHGGHR
jgi:class I fructose-bisphosphate aldolase